MHSDEIAAQFHGHLMRDPACSFVELHSITADSCFFDSLHVSDCKWFYIFCHVFKWLIEVQAKLELKVPKNSHLEMEKVKNQVSVLKDQLKLQH